MIEDLQKYAANNGGVLTEDEVYNFVRDNSNANNTNLNQLRKVYSYLGLNQSNLDNLEACRDLVLAMGRRRKREKLETG